MVLFQIKLKRKETELRPTMMSSIWKRKKNEGSWMNGAIPLTRTLKRY